MIRPRVPQATRTAAGRPGRLLLASLPLAALAALVAARALPRGAVRHALADLERRGDLCFQAGRSPQAEALWERVLNERPGAAGARNKLAVLRMRDARFADAAALLNAGIARAPRQVSFHFNLALVHFMQRDWDRALADLDTVEALHPEHGHLHFLRGMILDELGRHDDARREFVEALNSDPATPAAWERLQRSGPLAGPR